MIQRQRFTPQEDIILLERVRTAQSKGLRVTTQLHKLDKELRRKNKACYNRWRHLLREERSLSEVQATVKEENQTFTAKNNDIQVNIKTNLQSLPEVLGNLSKAGVKVSLNLDIS